jgi:predicted dehydrogenase
MVNILMLSKWHVHADAYARFIQSQPDAQISCVWDEDAKRGADWAKNLGVVFEPDLDRALFRSDVDAVLVETPTNDHCRVMVAAANAKKHIFTEKAMAPTLRECKAIAEAVAKNSVKFCISYPELTTSYVQYCKKAIDDGILGKITYMRFRNAHNGTLAGWLPTYWYDVEKAGGGAMMDLGCHPMYTASYLLGKPKRIASIFNNNYAPPSVDDNAVSVVEFEGNAIAVLETGFISAYSAGCFELLGTEGAVVQIDGKLKVRSNQFKDGWIIPDKLPDPRPPALRMWLDGIISGLAIPFDTERGIALTELLENAYVSHREQKIVCIG